jgi:hypothetical protein
MTIISPISLAGTLDSAAEAFFYQRPIPAAHRQETASMLISRQIQSGSNYGFFIPFTAETEVRSRLFSGEQLLTDFAHSHIQLIESARVLKLLGVDNETVTHSIRVADQRMSKYCYSKFCSKGECKSLTIAYMRYLASCNVNDTIMDLNPFLSKLTSYRDGKGKWNGFPYFYTLLMLSEVNDPLATQELQYAIPLLEKQLGQIGSADPISIRRQAIITKVLSRN